MKRSSCVWICLTLSDASKSTDSPPSIAGVARRALLQERLHALAEVAALRGEDLVAVLHRDRRLERRRVDRPVQAVLGEAHADRRVAQDVLRHLAAGLLELRVGHDA